MSLIILAYSALVGNFLRAEVEDLKIAINAPTVFTPQRQEQGFAKLVPLESTQTMISRVVFLARKGRFLESLLLHASRAKPESLRRELVMRSANLVQIFKPQEKEAVSASAWTRLLPELTKAATSSANALLATFV